MADAQIVDVIVEPLYDTQTILAAGALVLTYFQVPIGQGTSAFGAATTAKQLADTNMDLAGQLPAGYNFDLLGFRLQPAYTANATDIRAAFTGATLTFTIASKPYLRVPCDTIPAGMGPMGYGGATVDTVNRAVSWGVPMLQNAYTIGKKPLRLSQSQNFSVTLNWVSVVAVTTTIGTQPAAGMPVRVYLDGFRIRPVQ